MKKILLLAGVAATMLTSCTSEELVDISRDDEITFRAAMNLNDVTRGTEISNDNIKEFKVTALEKTAYWKPLFEKLSFKGTVGSEFKSDKPYLWYEGAELAFYAYSYKDKADMPLSDDMINPEPDGIYITDQQQTIDFVTQPKVEDQIDLVVAKTEATYANNRNGAIGLTFNHVLTEIQVLAKTDNQTYDFYVKGVKFTNIASTGQYDFDKNQWTVNGRYDDPKADYEVRLDNAIQLTSEPQNISATAKKGYAMLIPQQISTWSPTNQKKTTTASYLAVLLQIKVKDEISGGDGLQVFPTNTTEKDEWGNVTVINDKTNKYAWACIPIGTEWQAGHRVTYVLDFTKGAGYTDPNPDPNPDPEDPDLPDPDPEDPDNPGPGPGGDPILDGVIKYTVTVSEWTADPAIDLSLKGPNTNDSDLKK